MIGPRTVNPMHLSKSAEWGSPMDWLALARRIMGGIDLDPASSDLWNTFVQADRFIDKYEDGLRARWSLTGKPVSVWLNPPGDKTGALVKAFWTRLADLWLEGVVRCASWVGFNAEQLSYLQDHRVCPLDLPTHIPRVRTAYRLYDDRTRSVTVADQPTHTSYLTLLPDRRNAPEQIRIFRAELGDAGRIINAR